MTVRVIGGTSCNNALCLPGQLMIPTVKIGYALFGWGFGSGALVHFV